MSEAVLVTRGLKRSFVQGDVRIEVLRGVDLEVRPGEIVALLGPSGSGKSTFIRCLNQLEAHQQGSIVVDGVEITRSMRGIAQVRPGATTGDIGWAIQSFAEAERCSVVRDFCGHGVGRVFHDSPTILHYVEPSYSVGLKPGMIFTVEPMINLGRPHVKVLADGWTAVTRDRTLSAQFEHSVGITEDGCEIFTKSPGGFDKPYAQA